MLRLKQLIARTLSLRISLTVVLAIATLLTAALCIMFYFSRKAVKAEAIQKAEQTLEATVQQIDNVLLSVEQSTGNIYWEVLNHLDQPEHMFLYSQKIVETNPFIEGAAIAFEPYFYPSHGQYFMAYVHRSSSADLIKSDSPIVQEATFGHVPYPEQVWYEAPMKHGVPGWINPLKDKYTDGETITTFSLPLYGKDGKRIGILAADVSLTLLTQIVLSAKPSPNSYAILLGSNGSYIVHPDSNKLSHETVFTQTERGADPSVLKAALAMVAGESGYKEIRLNGIDNYIFYKPFQRAAVPGRTMEKLGWSVGIVYPEEDILGDYNRLLYVVLAITLVGLLLLLVLCQTFTHRQLLPLRLLTDLARRIAAGHYDEPVPDTRQQDEVGRLQKHFQQMQLALSANMGKLEQLNATLQEQTCVLSEAYEHAKEADLMKTTFLHNMTNQMAEPVGDIASNVTTLCAHGGDISQETAERLAEGIQNQGKTVTVLLNNLLGISQGRDISHSGNA